MSYLRKRLQFRRSLRFHQMIMRSGVNAVVHGLALLFERNECLVHPRHEDVFRSHEFGSALLDDVVEFRDVSGDLVVADEIRTSVRVDHLPTLLGDEDERVADRKQDVVLFPESVASRTLCLLLNVSVIGRPKHSCHTIHGVVVKLGLVLGKPLLARFTASRVLLLYPLPFGSLLFPIRLIRLVSSLLLFGVQVTEDEPKNRSDCEKQEREWHAYHEEYCFTNTLQLR